MFNYFKKISVGSKIGVAFPSGTLPPFHIDKIKEGLKKMGYEPLFGKNSYSQHGYLAGDDKLRAESFMDLWKDPEISIIWCARGGYGACRILDYLDFDFIKDHPKILIGMSDITALHCGFSKKVDFPTFLGPNLSLLFSLTNKKDTYKMLVNSFEYLSSFQDCFSLKNADWLNEGSATAPVLGGNLCVLTSLIGTCWQPEFKDKILLIEEVNEAPYRIDRMLFQMEKSGVLSLVKGVILSSFENCNPSLNQDSLNLSEIFSHYFSAKSYPVLYGFPSGHISYQKILPLGQKLFLDSKNSFFSF